MVTSEEVAVFMYAFYCSYNYCGLVRQVSEILTVSFSAYGTSRILDCWI